MTLSMSNTASKHRYFKREDLILDDTVCSSDDSSKGLEVKLNETVLSPTLKNAGLNLSSNQESFLMSPGKLINK